MFTRLRSFLDTHPSLRDALLWALPAIFCGTLLRAFLLHSAPYAYWGSDSRSYFDFAHKLYREHYFSLMEKRRFLYPVFVAVVTALPGSPLKWLAWLQHGLGLLTLVPLAYVVRKNFTFWRWWMVPLTLLYAAHPVILWYEHELLGEALFFSALMWAFAGWSAWVHAAEPTRIARLWWCFFIPFSVFILTKPSGRFYWPGILLGLVIVAAWRRLTRTQFAALGALMVSTLFVGDRGQGSWLLYVASFPVTQMQTPAHAEYKTEVRDLMATAQAAPERYYRENDDVFAFLENPAKFPGDRPHWEALAKKPGGSEARETKGERDAREALRRKVYMDLALEGILAQPLDFLHLGLDRLIASANLSEFTNDRFEPGYMERRFTDDYEKAIERQAEGEQTPLPLALGLSDREPLPPYAQLARKLNPAPSSLGAKFLPTFVERYEAHADFFSIPPGTGGVRQARLTFLGWMLVAGLALSCLVTRYRAGLGVWALAALGYLAGVFLVSLVHPRYFGAAWPVLVPILAVPADALLSAICAWCSRPAAVPVQPQLSNG